MFWDTRELTRGGEPLPELRQQRIDAAAIALDHRGEFVALGHLHADPADIDVGDLECPAAIGEIPVDQNPSGIGAVDLAGDDDLIAGRSATENPERLAAIFAEPRRIGLHDVFLEQPEEFLLLFRAGGAPIAAEHELSDAGDIEIIVK